MEETATLKNGARGQGPEKQGMGERVLRELLKSPKFKAELRLLASGIDPAGAAGLVRTFLWDDVETFMGTTSAAPAMVNYLVQVARELVAQLNTFPPAILIAFLAQLVKEVDFKAMEETVGELRLLLERLTPVVEGLREASSGVADALGAAGAAGKSDKGAPKAKAGDTGKSGAAGKSGGAGKSGAAGGE
ncbi:MAG: hypothetical protein PHP28_10805 [Actinomycetota bacterium]|nr:hypothetical protein [Actinomycetota bacterium]MDD5665854.1 hypothetical protein [Actinomycetota bacterium]